MPAWSDAWARALYGESGFYRHNQPSAHFRTSPMVSDDFASAVARLARTLSLDAVYDVGAGGGELLAALHRADQLLTLTGVDIRPRPASLSQAVTWADVLPQGVTGLVVANEWLDTVPAPVVELGPEGVTRIVVLNEGVEALGPAVADADPAAAAWLDRWWPLTEPGQRAVVGLARDEAARDLAGRVDEGLVLFVDYGHTRPERPSLGGIRCYRAGRQVPLALDGTADVTASVAVDSVADAIGGDLMSQAEGLARLGVAPPAGGSLDDLVRAAQVRELLDPAGLGGFHWIVRGPLPIVLG